jgi:hypothetical protein
MLRISAMTQLGAGGQLSPMKPEPATRKATILMDTGKAVEGPETLELAGWAFFPPGNTSGFLVRTHICKAISKLKM